MSFNMHVTSDHGVMRVVLLGDVDLSTKPQIQAEISSLVSDPSVERIIVDLSGVTFLDSSGIGTLVGCKRLAADAGTGVQVVGAAGQVAEVLDLVGVSAFLAQ